MNDQADHNPLPEVLQATWDRDQINALFNDLEQGAEVKHVQVRAAGSDGPQESAVTLQQAKQLFEDEAVQAIQIHYDFQGQAWCDTLLVAPDSVRVIRTASQT